MVNPGQYTHTLKVITTELNARNANGDYVASASSAFVTSCRFEVASKSAVVTAFDGKQIVYAGIIYLPNGKEDFPFGARVLVYDRDKLIAEGTIVQKSKGFHNRRLWL